MLVSAGQYRASDHGDGSIYTPRWQAFWRGFIYLPGSAAGAESVARFLSEGADSLPICAQKLKGAYLLVLTDRQSATQYCFIDPSGLYQAFCSHDFVSSSFLELAAAAGLGTNDLSPEALVDFLHDGCLSFGDTLFPGIKRMDPECIYVAPPSGHIDSIPRQLYDIALPPSWSFEQCLRSFAEAVAAENISVDLTGGIDSRLLAVALQHFGLSFEVALSGVHGNTDLQIAPLVAAVLGHELQVTCHRVDHLEAELPELFHACDGLFDVLREHRPHQLHSDRRRRGITLSLSAAGGELYKDFWWQQDFPFYSRSRANVERLYRLRIACGGRRHDFLRDSYRAISMQSDQRYLERAAMHQVVGNTQTYDHIYYDVKMRDYAGRFLTNHMDVVHCYAPYLDREMVAVGYNLPRHRRAFNTFHRQMITHYSRQAAALKTTEGGMSASSSTFRVAMDIPKYISDKLQRLARLLTAQSYGATHPAESPNHEDLWTYATDLIERRHSLEQLKDFGLLVGTLQSMDLGPDYLGSVLSLDLLLEHLAAAQTPLKRVEKIPA
jgi:asparagine synthetase B (glutamine-hydrolysing)